MPHIIDASATRAHLEQLTAWGMTPPMIADATGGHVYRDTVRRILNGQQVVTQFVADRLADVGPHPTPLSRQALPIGAQRRIRALQRRGWSLRAIDEHMGAPRGTCGQILLRHKPMSYRRWRDVDYVYDKLSARTEPGPSAYSTLIATRNQWPAPMDWEVVDIDRPDEDASVVADVGDPHEEARDIRRETVAELTRIGVSAADIAARLRVTQRTVERDRTHNTQEVA